MSVQGRTSNLHFLVVFLTISLSCLHVQCIQEFSGSCGTNIDLYLTQTVNSGILKMTLPESMDKYQNPSMPINCDIILSFASGMNLLVELYFLDIMPKSGDLKVCSSGLELFDQTGRSYYGGRLCFEAWLWEERHREKQQEKVVVLNSPLTIRFVSTGPYRGEGFKLHFNQFRPNWPCTLREYRCRQIERCVHDDVTCDGWDDCGDYSDERIEAGCDLLTASEICAIIMGIILLIGSVGCTFVFCIIHRRYSMQYGVRSESKVPIVGGPYTMEPSLGYGRSYNSQESLPSKHSRSTFQRRDSDADTIDKAYLEKADRQELEPLTGVRMSNRTADNMSERSYRSNPRRTVAQNLGTEAPVSESIRKSGQYSYGGRKGRSTSQSSLNRDKVDLANGKENISDVDSLEKEPVGSREKLSERERGRDRYGRDRDRDRYSDSDDYYDRDKYDDDRRRRSSRERDRRRSGRYSDDDSDSDRDYRRRRRRSYDRYSDDSDYEYERERRRRSRNRHSRERYDDQDGSNVEKDDEKDKDGLPKRRDSRERDRDRARYSREKLDDQGDSDRGRGLDKERSFSRRDSRERDRDRERYNREKLDDPDDSDRGRGLDKERSFSRRDSRERDRDRYRSRDERDRSRDRDDDDYDDRPARRRRSEEKRRGASAERDRLSGDLSKNENMRSRSRENIQSRDKGRRSPPLPVPPPPYAEEDMKPSLQKQSTFGEDKKYTQPQNLPPPPADFLLQTEKQSSLSGDKKRSDPRIQKPQLSEDRYREPLNQKLPPSEVNKHKEPQIQISSSSEVKYKEPQKPPSSDDRYREPQIQNPPPSEVKYSKPQKPPSSDDRYRAPQIQNPPPSEVKYTEPQKQTSKVDIKRSDQESQKPPLKEVSDVDRRRHTDNRRERYSHARWTPKKNTTDSPPPEYEDVAPPKSVYVAASYREESV